MTFHNRSLSGAEQTEIVQHIRAKLDRPIVLLGLMGSGKTRLGRMLARALDIAFYDCDSELELSAGRSAREVYDQIGPQAYEQAENRILKRLVSQEGGAVIASGGGAAIAPDLLAQIFSETLSIWVRADLPLMVNRTTRGAPRPQLVGQNAEAILKSMVDQYHPVYGAAHVIVDSHDGPASEVLNQTIYAVKVHLDKIKQAS